MILVKNLKFLLGLYLGKTGLETVLVMFWIENKPFQAIKMSILYGRHIGFFLRG